MGLKVQSLGITIDTKKVIKSSTPIGAFKIITGKFIKECTPLELSYCQKMCYVFRWCGRISKHWWKLISYKWYYISRQIYH